MTAYTITVQFQRELEDDLECIEGKKFEGALAASIEGRLVAQFANELDGLMQDTGLMDGSFHVVAGPALGEASRGPFIPAKLPESVLPAPQIREREAYLIVHSEPQTAIPIKLTGKARVTPRGTVEAVEGNTDDTDLAWWLCGMLAGDRHGGMFRPTVVDPLDTGAKVE